MERIEAATRESVAPSGRIRVDPPRVATMNENSPIWARAMTRRPTRMLYPRTMNDCAVRPKALPINTIAP